MQVTAARIVVLGTGGTIAGAASGTGGHLDYRAGSVGIGQLLAGLPALQGVELVAEQVAQVDSKDMAAPLWQALAARCAHWLAQPGVQGLVVTHGTDTLEETAWFLQRVLAPQRPVVLACAMRPADALSPDGPQNLADALAVAASPQARGVLAVCAGRVHAAADVAKVHPYRLDPFSSGEAGPVALVEDGRVRPLRPWPEATADATLAPRVAATRDWPRVEIVLSHAGADGRLVRELLAQGVRGLVVAGTGNGSVHAALEAALLEAVAAGVPVLRATRCLEGRVLPHAGDRLPAHPLSPVKARIDLQLQALAAA
jgi:L-asparaginase